MEKILSMSTAQLFNPQQFPKIYRFITERPLSDKYVYRVKLGIIGVYSALLLFGIIVQGYNLYHNVQLASQIKADRQNIQTELSYWKKIADEYKGYRDVYYRIAVLDYKLGNNVEAREYIKKALDLDPNFQEGRVLGAKIGF